MALLLAPEKLRDVEFISNFVKNKLRDWSISAYVYSDHVTMFLIISSRVRTAVINIK